MKPDDLNKLLSLRRQREDIAMQAAFARRTALARAEQEAADASAAVADHARLSRDKELASLSGLMGQTLHPHDLANLQSSLNAAADDHRVIVDEESAAQGQRDGCQADYDAARAEFRRRHGQSEKLSELISHERGKAGRRQLALAEAVSDEGHVPGDHVPGAPAHKLPDDAAMPEDGHAR